MFSLIVDYWHFSHFSHEPLMYGICLAESALTRGLLSRLFHVELQMNIEICNKHKEIL
jgi:hypothetical protein